MAQHRKLAQTYTGKYTAVILHQHHFTVFRKFTSLEGPYDLLQAV